MFLPSDRKSILSESEQFIKIWDRLSLIKNSLRKIDFFVSCLFCIFRIKICILSEIASKSYTSALFYFKLFNLLMQCIENVLSVPLFTISVAVNEICSRVVGPLRIANIIFKVKLGYCFCKVQWFKTKQLLICSECVLLLLKW